MSDSLSLHWGDVVELSERSGWFLVIKFSKFETNGGTQSDGSLNFLCLKGDFYSRLSMSGIRVSSTLPSAGVIYIYNVYI